MLDVTYAPVGWSSVTTTQNSKFSNEDKALFFTLFNLIHVSELEGAFLCFPRAEWVGWPTFLTNGT